MVRSRCGARGACRAAFTKTGGGGCAATYFLNSPSFREPYASRSGGRCVGLCPSWPGCLGGGCAAATWPDTFKVFRGIKPFVSSPSQSRCSCTRASHSLFIPRNLDTPALMSRIQVSRTTNSGSTVQRAPGPPRSQQTFRLDSESRNPVHLRNQSEVRFFQLCNFIIYSFFFDWNFYHGKSKSSIYRQRNTRRYP